MLILLLLRVHCVCVKVQEVQSSRSPPPTSTTEQKTRPPPLHTRYPLVSTSIEDLFYRSLVRTCVRTLAGSHVPCGGSIISDWFMGQTDLQSAKTASWEEGRELRGSTRIPSLPSSFSYAKLPRWRWHVTTTQGQYAAKRSRVKMTRFARSSTKFRSKDN